VAPAAGFGLVLIAVDDYPDPPGRLPSSRSAQRFADLVAGDRGGAIVDQVVAHNATDVTSAFNRWTTRAQGPASSIVYLVGHGGSNALEHWFLVPAEGDAEDRIQTRTLAEKLKEEWLRRQGDSESWCLLILDCCDSDVGVVNLVNELTTYAILEPHRYELWPVTARGASHSGHFVDAFQDCLGTFTENDKRIPLHEVFRRIAPRLGDLAPRGSLPDSAALENPTRVEATLTINLDALAELRQLISELPPESPVRSHFLAKAQGGEVGELAWHFCGRDSELAELSSWLRDAPEGLRVVTGQAGSGKSALLGQLVVQADPDMVDALDRSGLAPAPMPPATARPPAGVFDAIMHLTSKTLREVVTDVKTALHRKGTADTKRLDPAAVDLLDPLDPLLRQLNNGLLGNPDEQDKLPSSTRRLTVLADALDEAQEPDRIATFLRRAAALPLVRVVVGTRASLDEDPDRPPDPSRRELLDALRADDELVVIRRDRQAVAAYVSRRLLADGSPYVGLAERVQAIAERVADVNEPFLFARLATTELLNRPPMDPKEPSLAELLGGGHRGLFAAAVARLTATDPAVAALLHGLALARGRGVPETGGIWVAVARAARPDIQVTDAAVRATVELAAPYITLDGEGSQTTYRLAHQTYVEHFGA
jgi:hypothetical protein